MAAVCCRQIRGLLISRLTNQDRQVLIAVQHISGKWCTDRRAGIGLPEFLAGRTSSAYTLPPRSLVKTSPVAVIRAPPCAGYGTCAFQRTFPVSTSTADRTPVPLPRFGNAPPL